MSSFLQLRSLLFVPGDNERKLAKALQTPADAVVVDWEDGVAADKKAVARSRTTAVLSNRKIDSVTLIRLNPVRDAEFVLDVAEAGHIRADGFLLSKVVSVEEIREAEELIRKSGQRKDPRFFAMIESSAGLLSAPAIAACGCVAALLFGAEDFCADSGITCRKEELELLYARSALVTAARSAQRQAIDSPFLAFNDDQALMAAALRAGDLGFSGKLAIHPRQVEVINNAFRASRAEIEKAKRVVETFEANGEGVAVIDDVMVDEAVVKRARRILEVAKIPSDR
jgi:citrate lyase subunit beta / citryl-CoA lyase